MTRELHIHVEEPSMEAFLQGVLPRLLDPAIPRKIVDYSSKKQLLRELPKRLVGYSKYLAEYRPRSLVLIDRDDDDCRTLKADLERFCEHAGLKTKASPADDGSFDVVNRIVVEELEAWYFGAIPALTIAFRGVPPNLGAQTAYRDPDNVRGGTHESLLAVLQRYAHYRGLRQLPKIETARRIAAVMDVEINRSASYRNFRSGLAALVPQL